MMTLTATQAPHLNTKSLIAKLDDVAETFDLDVSTILAKKYGTQFLVLSDPGDVKEIHPMQTHPNFNNAKE